MSTSDEQTDVTGDTLQFDRVQVQRFNGLGHGLEASLCDGVNVIYGSNASGKTTLAQAIRAVLWPGRVGDQFPIVEAQFALGGSTWRVELEGGRCSYEKDHSPASRPDLPPSTHGPRYHLYLHDLLQSEGQEGDFARRILQEAQGGIDVEGAAEELGFEVPSRRSAQITTAARELRRKREETKSDQEKLRRRERNLDDLREKRADAREAARRAAALGQAISVAKARRRRDEAEAALGQYPEVMSEIRGDEDETLDSLQEDLRAAKDQIQEAEEQIEEAKETIRGSLIPDDGLPEGRVEGLKTKAANLREQERVVRERRADLKEAEKKEEKAWDRLPTGTDKEAAAGIDLPELEEVETHAKDVQNFRGRQEAFETAEELFGDVSPDTPVDTLRDGLRQLHRWLQRPDPDGREGIVLQEWIVLVGGLLVAVAGGALVLTGSGSTMIVGGLLILLGALIVGAEWTRRSDVKEAPGGRRALHETEFGRLGLEGPDEWSREAVENRADSLLGQLRKAEVATEKQETWERLQPKYEELEDTAEKLEEDRERLAEEMGLDPDVGSHSLFVLLERLSRWQAAYDDLGAKEEALEVAREEAEGCRTRLNEALGDYDLGPASDASEAQEVAATLDTAGTEFQEATRDLENAKEKKAGAIEDRDDAQARIRELYKRLGLEEGAEEELRDLAGQHESYEEAVGDKQEADAELSAALKQLRRQEGHAEWMEEGTEDALEQKLEAAQEEAEKEEEYVKKIESIKHEIQDAREEGTLEELQARYRERRDELAEERDRDYEKAVGSVLAKLVQEETRDQGLPPVFHRARELLAEITDHRYRLTLDRENAAFRAFDHVYEKPFDLDELSSGTQVQLVLAVRIAFLETQEQGCRAPLVLDETLANSDENRACAIIDAVKTICADGRQVLYLTAQADEVQKWRAQLDGEEGPDHSVIPLEELSSRDLPKPGGDGAAVPDRSAPESLPDPQETTYEELRDVLDVPDW
jgi:uncharacterized protein YhaN